jgi:hypothetical protein
MNKERKIKTGFLNQNQFVEDKNLIMTLKEKNLKMKIGLE